MLTNYFFLLIVPTQFLECRCFHILKSGQIFLLKKSNSLGIKLSSIWSLKNISLQTWILSLLVLGSFALAFESLDCPFNIGRSFKLHCPSKFKFHFYLLFIDLIYHLIVYLFVCLFIYLFIYLFSYLPITCFNTYLLFITWNTNIPL